MGDDRLRELERVWRASGALEDEAAWLAERRRAGGLDEASLELAAHLGHRAARVVLGWDATPLPDGEVPAAEVVRRLREDPARRMADLVALGLALSGEVQRHLLEPEAPLARRVLGALRARAACPCAEHDAALAEASARLGEHLDATAPVPGPATSRARWAAEAIQDAALVALGADGAEQIAVAAWWDAVRLLGRDRVWAVARAALVARCLGHPGGG